MNGYAGILNNKMIAKVLGVLLLVEALFFVLCALVSIIYNESDYIYFIYSILINITVGGFFCYSARMPTLRLPDVMDIL